MLNPLLHEVCATFVPVSNIEHARDWYCDLLGLSNEGPIIAGHLYVINMGPLNIVLDSKIYDPEHIFKVTPFQIRTNDIEAAFRYMKDKQVELVTEIENGHWFNFKDPDGNLLMICKLK